MKHYFFKNDGEIQVIKHLNKHKINCNLINHKLIKTNSKDYLLIMRHMEGDVTKLIGKLNVKDMNVIVRKGSKTISCLLKKNLTYIDLKLNNILFKKENNKLDICIGDIGGICKLKTTSKQKMGPFVTYLPWEYRKDITKLICSESVVIWFLGIIIMQLLSNDIKEVHDLNGLFHWSIVSTVKTKEDEKAYLKDLQYEIDFYKKKCPMLTEIFNLDPKKRPTFKKLLKEKI